MKLEKAKEVLKKELFNIRNMIDYYTFENLDYDKKYRMEDFEKAIETVLQALENYQIKDLSNLNDKLNNISATELQAILQPYYIQKENLEQKDKIINELKNRLENSIPKEIIEKEIEKLKETLIHYDKSNFLEQINLKRLEAKIEILQELLEEKE